jgi:hypothetical protein
MPTISPPLTEEEFKEMLRDCFTQGDIKSWSAHRGWKNRSSGSRALNWQEPQQSNLYEGYLDIYAAHQVGAGLAAKIWDLFSRCVSPLLRPNRAEPSPLSEVKLHINNWLALEYAREDGLASAEDCDTARRRAVEFISGYKGNERVTVYAPSAHLGNLG